MGLVMDSVARYVDGINVLCSASIVLQALQSSYLFDGL